MIERKDVEKLAALARITIPEAEMEKVARDIGTILDYVDQIKEVSSGPSSAGQRGSDASDTYSAEKNFNVGVKNIMREDGTPHESGMYTDALLKSAPKSADGYVEVKKILQ
jgi:Asp-tRNA(Asn)/Glu-tRNA(Gln) amidotransferase C subunit